MTNLLPPTKEKLDEAVLNILKQAAVGKDEKRRPKGLITHQIVQRLPDDIALPLVGIGGVGGAWGSKGAALAASQAVTSSIRRWRTRGLVRVRYIDCGGMMFANRYDTDGSHPYVIPSFNVCGLYEYTGPITWVSTNSIVHISLGEATL